MSDEAVDKPGETPVGQPPKTKLGDPISAERQTELRAILDAWDAEADHGGRKGPFDKINPSDRNGVQLTGAEVLWLAKQSGHGMYGSVPNLHLETLYVNTGLTQPVGCVHLTTRHGGTEPRTQSRSPVTACAC